MAEIYHGRGYVYSIQYHIVWCVKYRHKILNNNFNPRSREGSDRVPCPQRYSHHYFNPRSREGSDSKNAH